MWRASARLTRVRLRPTVRSSVLSLPRPTKRPAYEHDLRRGIDYFEVLGLNETASVEELISAFRVRIRAVHPDHHDGGGDRETLELLVRARQTLTGADRDSYLVARAARAAASHDPGESQRAAARPSAATGRAADIMDRWAAAAQRARPEWPPRAPRATSSAAAEAAVREAERQAAEFREEVRRATAQTVNIPETPFRYYHQPHPRPVPTPRPVHPTMPHDERPEYRRPVYRPTPSSFWKRNGGSD